MSRKAIDSKAVILLTVILTISTVTLTILPPASATASDLYASDVTNYPWSMGGHDLLRTGYTTASAPKTNATSWIYDAGTSDAFRSPIAIANGTVYLGSDKNRLYAVDMVTGELEWYTDLGSDVRAGPAVSADGSKVYISSKNGSMFCLNTADGSPVWSVQIAPGDTDETSSPAVSGNNVVVGSANGSVYCLNAGNGAVIWKTSYNSRTRAGAAIEGDKVYVFGDDNKVHCLNLSDGATNWDSPSLGSDQYAGYVVVSGEYVFTCTQGTNAAYKLNKTSGAVLATYNLADRIRGGVAVAYGNLYAVWGCVDTTTGGVACFDIATDAFEWNYTITSATDWYGIPVIADDMVFVLAPDAYIYALDATTANSAGSLVWKYDTGADTSKCDKASGAVADGRFIVGAGPSSSSKVYCFGPQGLYMDPASIVDLYGKGENFTVDIKVENITGLYSEYIGIQWDPAYLYCNSFDYVDTFMPDQAPVPGSYLDIAGSINNTAGNTTIYSRTLTGFGNAGGCNGTGTLLRAEFHVENYCPDGTWISFKDDIELLAYGAVTIDLPVQKCYFELNYPPPEPPVASFTESAPPYYANLTWISFDSSGSEDGWNGTHSVPIANYTWDFGDGNVTTVDAPTSTVTHMYSSTGTFTVNLTVTCEDDPVLISGGLTENSTWKNLTVTSLPPSSPPAASFTVSPPPYYANVTVVSFNASGSEGGWNGTHSVPIANYTWDFGDGNVTTVDAPTSTVTHMYSSTGTFTVNLTVTCEDDSMLIAEGLTANSTWKNLTVTVPVPVTVVHLVVRTLWTNSSAFVGANATVSNATHTVSGTTNSSGLTTLSLTTGLYNLTVEYDEVTLLDTTIYLNTDTTLTCKVNSEPFEIIDERDREVEEARKQATNRLYIGIGGGSVIGLVVGVAVVFLLRKKS